MIPMFTLERSFPLTPETFPEQEETLSGSYTAAGTRGDVISGRSLSLLASVSLLVE